MVVIWLGFLACIGAFLKSRPGRKAKIHNQSHDDPFPAATSGPVDNGRSRLAHDPLSQLDCVSIAARPLLGAGLTYDRSWKVY